MKAITYHRFGPTSVLRIDNLPSPTVPADGVLVNVRASSVNVIDSRTRKGLMSPFVNKKFPKIPGTDFAGIVSGVGANARRFRVGDEVFGGTNPFHGGGFAELVAVPENAIAAKPASLTFEEAAAVPTTGLAALYSLRELSGVKPGNEVLIYGSSGGAGLVAVQLAKHFGAHVTAVCGANGLAISRQMGADVAIDYSAGALDAASLFDVIVEFSSHFPFSTARGHLKPDGRFVESSPTIPKFIGSMLANPFRGQKHLMLAVQPRSADLEFLASLSLADKLKLTIAKVYPFSAARQAFEEQESGGVIGKIVVTPPFD